MKEIQVLHGQLNRKDQRPKFQRLHSEMHQIQNKLVQREGDEYQRFLEDLGQALLFLNLPITLVQYVQCQIEANISNPLNTMCVAATLKLQNPGSTPKAPAYPIRSNYL